MWVVAAGVSDPPLAKDARSLSLRARCERFIGHISGEFNVFVRPSGGGIDQRHTKQVIAEAGTGFWCEGVGDVGSMVAHRVEGDERRATIGSGAVPYVGRTGVTEVEQVHAGRLRLHGADHNIAFVIHWQRLEIADKGVQARQ